MNDALVWTVLIGGGLLVSGFSIGVTYGINSGTQGVMRELFDSGLLTPEKILSHYANQGNEKARGIMAAMNKAKQEAKDESDV